jgi:ABC-2 type transport system permease protein
MTTIERPRAAGGPLGDVVMLARQIGYEQRIFWRNPQRAIFTFALPVVLLVVFGGLDRGGTASSLGHINIEQYIIPSLLAYAVMNACFSNLAITLSLRRDSGILKRVRGTPLPLWAYFAGVVGSCVVVVALVVAIALVVGAAAYHVHLPTKWLPFIVAVLLGTVVFCALGFAVAAIVPNADAAPAVVNLPYLVLVIFSGTFYPIAMTSTLYKVIGFFPVVHFIRALFAPFDDVGHASPWAGHDLLVLALWGLAAVAFTLRRFRWEPNRT